MTGSSGFWVPLRGLAHTKFPRFSLIKKIKMSFHQIKDKIIAKESRLTLSRWSGHYLPIRGATCEAKLYSEDCSVSVEFKQRKERCWLDYIVGNGCPAASIYHLGAAPSKGKKTVLWVKAAHPLKSPEWIPPVLASIKLIVHIHFIEIFMH